MENKKIIITPVGNEPDLIKKTEKFKNLIEEMRIQTERDLSELDAIIKQEENDVINQREIVKGLEGAKWFCESDKDEAEWEKDLLPIFEKDLKDSLDLKKRLIDFLSEGISLNALASIELEKIEEDIAKFKKILLSRSTEEEN